MKRNKPVKARLRGSGFSKIVGPTRRAALSQTFRHPDILEIARTEGKVTVDGLAERFGNCLSIAGNELGGFGNP